MVKFSVVIPTYNEGPTIAEVIKGVEKVGVSQVIVVDDGSTDGTVGRVEELSERYGNIVLVERGRKLGIGSAIRDGIRKALETEPTLDAVVTMDADLSHDPHEIPKLVEACDPKTLVVGSRYVGGGIIEGWGVHRKLISATANALANLALGLDVRDATSGFRCYGVEVARAVLSEAGEAGFSFQVETVLRARRMGFRVVEVPIRFVNRVAGRSKLGLGEITGFLRFILRTFFKEGESTRVLKFLLVGLSGMGMNELVLWLFTELLGLHYVLSAALGAEVAIINNFCWNEVWTFRDRAVKGRFERFRRFLKFNLSRVAGILIALGVLTLLTEVFGIHYLVSNIFAILVGFVWNYLLSVSWVWKQKGPLLETEFSNRKPRPE